MHPALNLHDKFVGHLRYLNATRTKIERLYEKQELVDRDVDQVYAGLFLEAITSSEQLIDDLSIGLVVGSLSISTSVASRVSISSSKVAREVIYGHAGYVDWLPYSRTEEIANRYLRRGRPFTSLDNSFQQPLREFVAIRNAIAHKSNFSKRRFQSRVIGSSNLMQREKTPVGYLRSSHQTRPVLTRYEYYVSRMVAITFALCR